MSSWMTTGMPSRLRSIQRTAQFSDTQARSDREADHVWEVRTDCDHVRIDGSEEPASLLGGQTARWGLAVPLGGLDAFQLADRVGGDGLVEHSLLHDSGDDRADGAAGVRCVPNFLGGGAVLVLDSAPSLLQSCEEGIDLSDVTLVQAQPAELGEDKTFEPVPIGVDGGVLTPLGDLPHPHGCGVPEPGLRSEQFGALATALAKLVLQGLLCRGPRCTPTFNAAGQPIEVTDPAAGHPLTTFSGDVTDP